LKIVAKPLQMETWLLLTASAYRKSPNPYQMLPSPSPYDLPFRHNTARLAYHSALWPFTISQGQWFTCYL